MTYFFICLSTSTLNTDGSGRLFINPIRNATNTNIVLYNATTKEITYDTSAPSATTATTTNITNDVADTITYIPFVNAVPSGTAQALKANTSLTYNSATAQIGVPRIKPVTIVDVSDTIGSIGQYLSSTGAALRWVSPSTFTSQGFYLYNTNIFTPTVANTAQIFPLATSSTISYNSGFSAALTSNRITYSTSTTKNFLITVTMEYGQVGSGTQSLGFEVRKNGAIIQGSQRSAQGKQFSGGQYLPCITSHFITQLANTNYLEIYCVVDNILNWTPAAFGTFTPTGLTASVPTLSITITSID